MQARSCALIGLLLLGLLACDVASANLQNSSKYSRSLYSKKRAKGRGSKALKIGKEYVPDAGPWSSDVNEPTCEQLREMWRQSKRHSRAAESTNEIPQYLDPFARGYPYSKQLLEDASTPLRPRAERRPVLYGRVVHGPADSEPTQQRAFDVLRTMSANYRGQWQTPSDTGVVLQTEEEKATYPHQPPARGSFHKLRELVKEERARDSGDSHKSRTDTADEGWPMDEGRIVTSPSDHKFLQSAMLSDSPYGARPFDALRSSRWRNGDSRMHRMKEPRSDHHSRDLEKLLRDAENEDQGKSRHHAVGKPTSAWDLADAGSYHGYARTRNSDHTTQNFPRDKVKFSRPDCKLLQGKKCYSDVDCTCPGVRRCHRGRCLSKFLNDGERDDSQNFQDSPDEESESWSGDLRRRILDEGNEGQDKNWK